MRKRGRTIGRKIVRLEAPTTAREGEWSPKRRRNREERDCTSEKGVREARREAETLAWTRRVPGRSHSPLRGMCSESKEGEEERKRQTEESAHA